MEGGFTWRTSYLSTGGPTPPPVFGHSAVLLSHSYLVTYGGAVECSDKHIISGDLNVLALSSCLWTPVLEVAGEMPSPRASHACVAVEPNRILVHGGVIGAGALADEEVYVIEIDFSQYCGKAVRLNTDGRKPSKRYAHTLTTVGSKVFLFGGTANGVVLSDLWVLENYCWEEMTVASPFPEARCYHTAGHYTNHLGRDFLIVFGGRGKEQRALGDMWTLTATTSGLWRWVWVANGAQGRYMHTLSISGEDCFLIGGRGDIAGEPLPSVHIDLSSCKMKLLPVHPAYRQVSCFEQGCIYLVGGYHGKDTLTNLVTCIEIDNSAPTPIRRHRNAGLSTPQKIYCAKLHLSPFVTISSGKLYDHQRNLYETSVKKVAISRLHTEAKKLNLKPNSPAYSIASNANDSAHNFIIHTILRPAEKLPNEENLLPKDVILALLDSAAAIVESEVESLELREPVKVFGGVHGQLADLLRYFREYGEPSDAPFAGDIDSTDYVFAGEHLGGGKMNVETLCLLLALKVKFPESIYILRPQLTQCKMQLLSLECTEKYAENPQDPASLCTRLITLMGKLPTQAAIADTVLCRTGRVDTCLPSAESEVVTLLCEEDAKGGLDICDKGFTVKFTSAPSLPGQQKRPGCLIVVTKSLQIVPKFLAPREYV